MNLATYSTLCLLCNDGQVAVPVQVRRVQRGARGPQDGGPASADHRRGLQGHPGSDAWDAHGVLWRVALSFRGIWSLRPTPRASSGRVLVGHAPTLGGDEGAEDPRGRDHGLGCLPRASQLATPGNALGGGKLSSVQEQLANVLGVFSFFYY